MHSDHPKRQPKQDETAQCTDTKGCRRRHPMTGATHGDNADQTSIYTRQQRPEVGPSFILRNIVNIKEDNAARTFACKSSDATAAKAPPELDNSVLTKTAATVCAFSTMSMALPPLKARKSTIKMNPPSATKGTECPGNG